MRPRTLAGVWPVSLFWGCCCDRPRSCSANECGPVPIDAQKYVAAACGQSCSPKSWVNVRRVVAQTIFEMA